MKCRFGVVLICVLTWFCNTGTTQVHAGERLYVTNFDSENISVINTSANSKLADIHTGRNPHGIAVSPDGARVYVSNEGDNNVSVIDAASNRFITTVSVGSHPNQLCVSVRAMFLSHGQGGTDELVLNIPPGHHLAGRKHVKPSDLEKETFISREPGSATRAVVENYLQLPSHSPEASLELGNPEAVKLAVKNGLGIAFLSRFAVDMEVRAKSLIVLKISGLDINRELKIVYRKGKHLSRAATALIEAAQKLQ